MHILESINLERLLASNNTCTRVYYMYMYMSTTQEGGTPLVVAASCGKCDVVIELLDNGADVNAQNDVSPINTVIV